MSVSSDLDPDLRLPGAPEHSGSKHLPEVSEGAVEGLFSAILLTVGGIATICWIAWLIWIAISLLHALNL